MRRIGKAGAVLTIALLLPAAALAQDEGGDSAYDVDLDLTPPPSRVVTATPPPASDPDTLEESALTPSDGGAAPLVDRPADERATMPDLIRRHIAAHSDFVQPFLDPAVYPEISARLINEGGYAPGGGAGQFSQFGYVSLYYFDLYAPLVNVQQVPSTAPNRLRMDLKVPVIAGPQVFTLFLGGSIPTTGQWTDGGTLNGMIGYAVGSRDVSLQIRLGYGYDILQGELTSPAVSFFGDAALSLSLSRHAQILLEADGRKLALSDGGTIRAFPGFRFFPFDQATFSIGAGAMWWADTFDGNTLTQLTTRRLGAFLDVGYVFF